MGPILNLRRSYRNRGVSLRPLLCIPAATLFIAAPRARWSAGPKFLSRDRIPVRPRSGKILSMRSKTKKQKKKKRKDPGNAGFNFYTVFSSIGAIDVIESTETRVPSSFIPRHPRDNRVNSADDIDATLLSPPPPGNIVDFPLKGKRERERGPRRAKCDAFSRVMTTVTARRHRRHLWRR